MISTPILFLVYNRPNLTKQVFDTIRTAKPDKLYIAADGPKLSSASDKISTDQVREIVQSVDWECNISTLFSDQNQGCKIAVSNAISWFFKNEEMGIIIEDDCLPDHSFFRYCQELLLMYKDDQRILHIGGTNPLQHPALIHSYYYSKYNRIWGWATWRRAWKYYDRHITCWPKMKKERIHYNYFDIKEAKYWEKIWDKVYADKIDTWDYQWFLCRLSHGAAIIPSINLISNIGFGSAATHASDIQNPLSRLTTYNLSFPLNHPDYFYYNKSLDKQWSQYLTNSRPFNKIFRRFKHLINS
ncbi:MAG: hypothetical protein HQ528_05835 [Candidatus Marinimicrobia bacterium]|nr:hypothetical protein [Candidatus Neomarinimicrobiota bacterium]